MTSIPVPLLTHLDLLPLAAVDASVYLSFAVFIFRKMFAFHILLFVAINFRVVACIGLIRCNYCLLFDIFVYFREKVNDFSFFDRASTFC